jgi:hypothetical protein
MLNHFRSIHLSEEKNEISGRRQLALLGAVGKGSNAEFLSFSFALG